MIGLVEGGAEKAIPLIPVSGDGLQSRLSSAGESWRRWVQAQGYRAEGGRTLPLPGPEGQTAAVLAGVNETDALSCWAAIAAGLPTGCYRIAAEQTSDASFDPTVAALGWALGLYRFDRYVKRPGASRPQLIWPENTDRALVEAQARAIFLVRDLITTPANDMGPAELADAALQLAGEWQATHRVIVGAELLQQGFPMVHAVGRACAAGRAPRLVDISWGRPDAPPLALVGKGVCFDSGGLDLKPPRGMLMMKKDMGGAAHALALARLIVETGLDVRFRLLIPAADNMPAADAFRPLDVLRARNGKTVEIGDTDAEGRLLLADALTCAAEDSPELIIDFATLTGASRIALGTDVPSFFTGDDALASSLTAYGSRLFDPVWRLPLHRPYRRLLNSDVADISSCTGDGYAGAITAALFLAEFLPTTSNWLHLDVMAWNTTARPGQPKGGEAQGLRAVYAYLQGRFA